MGWENRDYNREDQPYGPRGYRGGGGGGAGGGGGGFRFGSRLTGSSAVTWILVANIIVFLLDGILTNSQRGMGLSPFIHGHFSVDTAINRFQIWRFVSYQFLHGGFMHLFFNMLTLYFFGPMVEHFWGTKRFVAFYLICGIGSVIVFTVLAYIPDLLLPGTLGLEVPLVGASGCIFGVLACAALIAPNQTVMLLIPPIPMKMRTLVLFFLGIAALSVIVGSGNAGGEAAHLGGAVVGFLLVKQPRLLGFTKFINPDAIRQRKEKKAQKAREKQSMREKLQEAEVDRILAKVKEHGLQSLSEKEKKTLQHETDRKQAG